MTMLHQRNCIIAFTLLSLCLTSTPVESVRWLRGFEEDEQRRALHDSEASGSLFNFPTVAPTTAQATTSSTTTPTPTSTSNNNDITRAYTVNYVAASQPDTTKDKGTAIYASAPNDAYSTANGNESEDKRSADGPPQAIYVSDTVPLDGTEDEDSDMAQPTPATASGTDTYVAPEEPEMTDTTQEDEDGGVVTRDYVVSGVVTPELEEEENDVDGAMQALEETIEVEVSSGATEAELAAAGESAEGEDGEDEYQFTSNEEETSGTDKLAELKKKADEVAAQLKELQDEMDQVKGAVTPEEKDVESPPQETSSGISDAAIASPIEEDAQADNVGDYLDELDETEGTTDPVNANVANEEEPSVAPTSQVDKNNDYESNANLYEGVEWNHLPMNAKAAAMTLGFVMETWDGRRPVSTDALKWEELTDEQHTAATILGYQMQSWNEKAEDFATAEAFAAAEASNTSVYTNAWGTQDEAEEESTDVLLVVETKIEGTPENSTQSGSDTQTEADADSETQEVPTNDQETEETETEEESNVGGGTVDYSSFYWDELPDAQQDAATELGYDKNSWDMDSPVFTTYLRWNEMTFDLREAAKTLGYRQGTWNSEVEDEPDNETVGEDGDDTEAQEDSSIYPTETGEVVAVDDPLKAEAEAEQQEILVEKKNTRVAKRTNQRKKKNSNKNEDGENNKVERNSLEEVEPEEEEEAEEDSKEKVIHEVHESMKDMRPMRQGDADELISEIDTLKAELKDALSIIENHEKVIKSFERYEPNAKKGQGKLRGGDKGEQVVPKIGAVSSTSSGFNWSGESLDVENWDGDSLDAGNGSPRRGGRTFVSEESSVEKSTGRFFGGGT